MVRGFVLDRSHGANLQSLWVEGSAESFTSSQGYLKGIVGFWGDFVVKTSKIDTYRCGGCGYLESFAVEDPECE